MDLKKNPNVNLELRRTTFLLIGFTVALTLIVTAYESGKETQQKPKKTTQVYDMEEDIEVTRPEDLPPPPPPPPPAPPEPQLEVEIEIKEDDEELVNEAEGPDVETDEEEMIWEEEVEEIFTIVETMPTLGDCEDENCTQSAIMKHISRNFKYPERAKQMGIEGRIIIEFVVGKDGVVTDVKVLRGIEEDRDGEMSDAAIKAVESLPEFTPGAQVGKKVKVKYTVPIMCTLG